MLRVRWLFVAAALIGYSLAEPKCGKHDPNSGKEWPWMVGVFGDGQFRCLGTLVAEDRIITSARCIDPKNFATKEWAVGLADDKKVAVDKVFMHEEYAMDKDKTSDIAILSLKDNVKSTDAVMPVCQQEKGKEEKMSDCRTVQLLLDVDNDNGGERENVMAKSVLKGACHQKTFDFGYIKKDADLLCVKMDQKNKGGDIGCDRENASPLYCKEEKLWYLSGIALSCGNKQFPGAKASHGWFLDVCNCMDDMVPAGEESTSGDDEGEDIEERPGVEKEEMKAKEEEEEEDKTEDKAEAAVEEEAKENKVEKEVKEGNKGKADEKEKEKTEKKESKKKEKKEKQEKKEKKETKEKKDTKREEAKKMGWAKKKKKGGKKDKKDA